ncbi:putative ABC transport system, ATP-binding protein [Corynebacterium urealyticum DSM 7111]|nr:putative ABC transport system, ATP-binding protein [Corynebacterium urealyticum DSM 7111]
MSEAHNIRPYPGGSADNHHAEGVESTALTMSGLSKSFGDTRAVDNLNLRIPRGSMYGVVGPNGAGKTTALTIATGLLEPTSGNAWICGIPMWDHASAEQVMASKQRFGLLADGLPIFDRLTAREYLDYLGHLRGMDPQVIEQRTEELLEAMDLTAAEGKYIVDFSAGMTKKILLAGAMLHGPEVLILDEPFEAVDPVSGQVIRDILRRYVAAGGTVVMSSHVMELVEGLCDHVAIIAEGRVLRDGTIDEVRQGKPLNEVFVSLVGGRSLSQGSFNWLGSKGDA